MSETIEVTGARLMEIREGFLQLQGRVLPPLSDMRVAMLFTGLRPVMETYVERLREIQKRAAEAGDDAPEVKREMQGGLLELAQEKFAVPAPRRRLRESDLPVAMKGKDGNGELNAEGRAAIAVALAPEFFEIVNPDE